MNMKDENSLMKNNSGGSHNSPDLTAATTDNSSVSSSKSAKKRPRQSTDNESRMYQHNATNSNSLHSNNKNDDRTKGLEEFHASVRMLHEETSTSPPANGMFSHSEVNTIPTSGEEMERRNSSFTSFVDHAKTYWTDLGKEADAMKTGKIHPQPEAKPQVNPSKNHIRPTLNYIRSDDMKPHRDISIYPALPKVELESPPPEGRPSANSAALEAFQISHAQKLQGWKDARENQDENHASSTRKKNNATANNSNSDYGCPQKVATPQPQQPNANSSPKAQEEEEEEVSIFELFERRRSQKRQSQARGRVQAQQRLMRSMSDIQGRVYSTTSNDSSNNSRSKNNRMALSSSNLGTSNITAYQAWLSASTSNINDNDSNKSPRRGRRRNGTNDSPPSQEQQQAKHDNPTTAKQDSTATKLTMENRCKSLRNTSPRRLHSSSSASSSPRRQRRQMSASANSRSNSNPKSSSIGASSYPSQQAKQDETKKTHHSDSQGSDNNWQQMKTTHQDQKQNQTTKEDVIRGMEEATCEHAKEDETKSREVYPSQHAKEDDTKSANSHSTAGGAATTNTPYPSQQAKTVPTSAVEKSISASSAIRSEQAILQQQDAQHRQRQEAFQNQQQQRRGANGGLGLSIQPSLYTGSLITADDLDDTEHSNRLPLPSQPPTSPATPGTQLSWSSSVARRRRAIEDASQKAQNRSTLSTSTAGSNSNTSSQETLPGAYQASPGKAYQRNRAIRNSVISSHSMSASMSRRGVLMPDLSCRSGTSFAIDGAGMDSVHSAMNRNKRASLTSIVSIEEEKKGKHNTADEFYEAIPTYAEEHVEDVGEGEEGHVNDINDVEVDRQQLINRKMAASMVLDSGSSSEGDVSDEFWHPSLPTGRATEETAQPPPDTDYTMDGSCRSNHSAAPSPPQSPPSRERKPAPRNVVRRTDTQKSQASLLSNLTTSNDSFLLDEEEKEEIEPFDGVEMMEVEDENGDDSIVPPLQSMSRQTSGPLGRRVGIPDRGSSTNIVPNRVQTLPLSQRRFSSAYTAQSRSGNRASLMSVSENGKSLDDSTSDFSMPSFRYRSSGTSSSGSTYASEAAKLSAGRIARNMSLYMRAGALPVAATVARSDDELEEELREKLEMEIRQELEIEMEEFRCQLISQLAATAQPVTADVIPMVDGQRISMLGDSSRRGMMERLGNDISMASALEERQRMEAAAVRSNMNRELGRMYLQMKSHRSLQRISDNSDNTGAGGADDDPFYDVERAETNCSAAKERRVFWVERLFAVLLGAGFVIFIYEAFLR